VDTPRSGSPLISSSAPLLSIAVASCFDSARIQAPMSAPILLSKIGSVPKGFELIIGIAFFIFALAIPIIVGAGLVQSCVVFVSLRKAKSAGWRRQFILARQVSYISALAALLVGLLYVYIRSIF
jgi:hypothetical protein